VKELRTAEQAWAGGYMRSHRRHQPVLDDNATANRGREHVGDDICEDEVRRR
jgi:hypothetical protein